MEEEKREIKAPPNKQIKRIKKEKQKVQEKKKF